MLGKGLLEVTLAPAIEGIELIADQVSVVVGLGLALDGDAAELHLIPVRSLFVGNRHVSIGSDISVRILDVLELHARRCHRVPGAWYSPARARYERGARRYHQGRL